MSQALTVSAAYALITTLSLEDQRALNSLLVANIRLALRHKAVATSIEFRAGDIIVFDGKTRGTIFLEVTGFSRDRTKIKGRQVSRGLKTKIGTNWTVGANVAKASTLEKAMAW
jgi:hypothetical protein